MEELLERLAAFRDHFDLRGKVAEDPWRAVGLAALAGLWLGYAPPTFPRTRSKIAEVALATIGAIALRLVREAAFRQVAEVAKQWWVEAAAAKDSRSESVPIDGQF